MLTLLYPIYNRAALFRRTLQALARQTLPRDDFEIVVVDDGSTEPDLLPLLRTAREAHGLPIRYFRIDVTRLPWTVFQHAGANNPAAALNVGIRQARGTRVILTSPEVEPVHVATLDRIASWPLAAHESLVANVWDPSMVDHPHLQGWLSGGTTRRVLHFFGTFWRAQLVALGGFEERFTCGWGYEDTEFCHRFLRTGGQYVFSGEAVMAWHHPHPRVEQVTDAGNLAAKELCDALTRDPTFRCANVKHDWGSPALIVDTRWTDG